MSIGECELCHGFGILSLSNRTKVCAACLLEWHYSSKAWKEWCAEKCVDQMLSDSVEEREPYTVATPSTYTIEG